MKEASVVIPAYNRSELLTLTLTSLQCQDFPPDEWELVVVDDASDDDLAGVVLSMKFDCEVKYVRLMNNGGRSGARNAGIRVAAGRYIIYCDGDMIVPQHFVRGHIERIKSLPGPNVVSGSMSWMRIYTHLYPQISTDQQIDLRLLAPNHTRFLSRLPREGEQTRELVPILYPSDIINNSFRELVFQAPWAGYYTEVTAKYGPTLEGFEAPWVAFITGNVSCERDLLLAAGGFDENFAGHGLEDWELGYRLHRMGVKFYCDDTVTAYHQEHPIDDRISSGVKNYKYFLYAHPTLDIMLFSLLQGPWGWNLVRYSDTLQDFYNLKRSGIADPLVLAAFRELLSKQVEFIVENGIPPTQQYSWNDVLPGWSPGKWHKLRYEIDMLQLRRLQISAKEQLQGANFAALLDAIAEWVQTTPRTPDKQWSCQLPNTWGKNKYLSNPASATAVHEAEGSRVIDSYFRG